MVLEQKKLRSTFSAKGFSYDIDPGDRGGQTLSSCAAALGVIFIPMGRLACLIFYAN